MITQKRCFGDEGEKLARRYLEKKGYRILGQNYQTRWGELDLIVKHKNRIIFVEVKTRSSHRFGLPEQAIDWKKKRHLKLMAKWYMMKEKRCEENFQIDLVAIDYITGSPEIRHLENIIEE